MPVTTRRRAAALAKIRRSSLKKPTTTTSSSSSSITKPTLIPTTPTRPLLRRRNNTPQPHSAPPTTTTHHLHRTPIQRGVQGAVQITSPTRPQLHRRRRQTSLPNSEPLSFTTSPPSIACAYGHRLFNNKASWRGRAIVSPTLQAGGLQAQARFYERELARIGAGLAATGEAELWRVRGVVDLAVGMLRGIVAKGVERS